MSKMFKHPRTEFLTAYTKQYFSNKRQTKEQFKNSYYHCSYEQKESLRWSKHLKADQGLKRSDRMYTDLSLKSSVRSLDACWEKNKKHSSNP